MTIKDVYEFYYKDNEKLAVRVEMIGGVVGRSHDFTREEFEKFIDGWENDEVVTVSYENYYVAFSRNTTNISAPKLIPSLYILYK